MKNLNIDISILTNEKSTNLSTILNLNQIFKFIASSDSTNKALK